MPVELQGRKIALKQLLGLIKTTQKLRGLKESKISLQGLLTDDFINDLISLCGTQLNFNLACNSAHVVTAGF